MTRKMKTIKVKAHLDTNWVGSEAEEVIEVDVPVTATPEERERVIGDAVWEWGLETSQLSTWFEEVDGDDE